MNTAFCGFIIHVRDLDNCRTFYRDILRLGAPISDSSFRTEFELASGVRLILLKAREEEILQGDSKTALRFVSDDIDLQTEILASFGYLEKPDSLKYLQPGVRCFQDPEGNPFYLVAKGV